MATFRDVFSALGHAFAGVDFEGSAADLAADEARLRQRHRVTVKLPKLPEGSRHDTHFVVYSRVAVDAALLEAHVKHTTDFDAFEVAEGGEVLNVLVDDGYHRIHAVPVVGKRKRGTRELMLAVPADPENGILLFEGDVHSDVGLA
jgi:hypothetical protein